jgi:hypothetical protein
MMIDAALPRRHRRHMEHTGRTLGKRHNNYN